MPNLARLALLVVLAAPVWLRAASGLPDPASFFGFPPGADYKLFNYEQSVAYLRKLAASSRFMTLVEAGKSSEGRTFYFALVSSPKNLARLDRYREINRRLAHPEHLSDEDAHALAREGRAFVHIDGGLHANEVAGPQMMPVLAYDLLRRADEPAVASILDNVVFMLWPTINPDGQTMVADWYMSHVGTPNENAPLPGLYQDYVGHDNNRDAYMLDMIESRVIEHTWRQWEPAIVYVLHQSPPFPARIWLPPFADPIATHAPPLVSQEVNMIGMAIAKGLDEHGQTGATHMGTGYDAWYPGYVDYAPVFKNIPAFWTETAGNGAAPRLYAPDDIPANLRTPKPLYPSPWLGGWWRLADAVAYDETAALSVLDFAAKYRESLLYNRYLAGMRQIQEGRTMPPFAYVVPREQRDPVAAVELLRRLAFSGVRISQLSAAATIDGATYAAGTWVVPTDQEFAALAREVLDVQKYPDVRESPNGPLDQPYDVAGWTLPLQMGVNVVPIVSALGDEVRAKMRPLAPAPSPRIKPAPYNSGDDPDAAIFDSVPGIGFDSEPAAAPIVPPKGELSGSGSVLFVNPAENNAFRAINAAVKQGAQVFGPIVPPVAQEREPQASSYLIDGLTPARQTELVTTLALRAAASSMPATDVRRIRKPRLGLFQPSPASIDEGWTRWVLEQYGFEYSNLTGDAIQAGNLGARFDVIIITDEPRGVLAAGGRGGALSAGNADRVRALEEFVTSGGTLVCFNRSSSFAIDQLHLPVTNAIESLRRDQIFAGGSLLNVLVNTHHPIMAGMPDSAAVFFDGGPVFEPRAGFNGTVLARYQDAGTPLASGYLVGETYLLGKAAALDVEVGRGHVVLFGFRPQWRGQSFGTFRVIFNAALSAH
jgi:hypothetical protein